MLVKSVVILGVVFSSSLAMAGQKLTCDRVYGNGPEGYVFRTQIQHPGVDASATLKIPGERGLRKLKCVSAAINPGPGGPDRFRPRQFCSEPSANSGYQVSVRTGGLAGITVASVKAKNNRALPTDITELLCH
jgi:hypothetical protein